MIFGILNIGFGLLGLAGLLTQKMFESFAAQTPNPTLNSMMAFMDEMNKDPTVILWRDISIPLEGVASVALLAAGIGLLLLKNWARLGSIAYAIYKMIFVVANLIVLYTALGAMLQKALQNAPAVVVGIAAVSSAVGVVISLAYPGLLIFFMTRPKIVSAFQPPAPAARSGP